MPVCVCFLGRALGTKGFFVQVQFAVWALELLGYCHCPVASSGPVESSDKPAHTMDKA